MIYFLKGGGRACLDFGEIGDLQNYTLISVGYYHYSYGYDFDGITIVLAWVVLLIHALLVVIQAVVLVVHRGWISSAWARVGDVVTLAMNSTPTELLKNTGAGVSASKAPRINDASVRQVTGEERVELLLRDENYPRGP